VRSLCKSLRERELRLCGFVRVRLCGFVRVRPRHQWSLRTSTISQGQCQMNDDPYKVEDAG
jgi:hypothetical protein